MLAAVDSHTLIKFFHVFPAIVWIGGAVMLTILAELTKRANEPGAMARFAPNFLRQTCSSRRSCS